MTSTIWSRRIPLAASTVIASGVLTAACGWAQASSAATMPGTPLLHPCTASSLIVANGGIQGAAGSSYEDIVFTNTSHRSCTLDGYPDIALTNSSGRQIGAAATHDPVRSTPVVVLAPSGSAHATLRIVDALNFPAKTCHPVRATSLRISPPGSARALRLPTGAFGCANTAVKVLSVNDVTPGAGY